MPVYVVNDPKDKAFRQGPRGEVQKRVIGALYQLYRADTYSGDKSPSSCDTGTTSYTVDIPRCGDNCQCLIVASVNGQIKGKVESDVTDYFVGKARASIDAKLWSSLGSSQAQLAIVSGDGAESYEASASFSKEPVNVKITGKVGDGPLEKVSAYSSGPVSFNACYADFSVTAEGAVNSFINWACDDVSYAQGTVVISHKCKISAYCVCNGERTLIFEWSADSDGRSSYSKRSTRDEEYEKKLKKDKEELRTNVGKTVQNISQSDQVKLEKEIAPRPKRRSSEDGLAKFSASLRSQISKDRG